MDYLSKKQFIQTVDRKGQATGKIEKWKAHRKGVLHKAFTVVLFYKGKILLQHRKHIAFDGFFDITSSSHFLIKNEKMENTKDAIYKTLKREWNLNKKDLLGLKYKGSIYYKAKDKKNGLIEHEINNIFICNLKKIPRFNSDFAYGYSIVDKSKLYDKALPIKNLLAPWVKTMLLKKLV